MYFIQRNNKPLSKRQSLSKARKVARRKCQSSGGEVKVFGDERFADRKTQVAVYGYWRKLPRAIS